MRTIRIEVIMTPFAKLIFFMRIPKKNNGKLINALILISPPNFFFWNKEKMDSSMGPSEK